jgi:acyl carrier protein
MIGEMKEQTLSIEAELAEQIYSMSGIDKSHIRSSAEIYHDLRVHGMDLVELIVFINKKYGTIFDGFDPSQYGPPETGPFLRWILERMGWRKTYKSLTVGHLIEVVQCGAWFDPTTACPSGGRVQP